MQFTSALLALGLLISFGGDRDAPQLHGLRLEMTRQQAHKLLQRDAHYKSQDENQEVWTFTADPVLRSIIVGFSAKDRVRYVTELAKDGGTPLSCEPLGEVGKAHTTGSPGDFTFTRSWKEHEDQFIAIARGTASHLSSCSVKKVGEGAEDEEQEQRERHKPPTGTR